MATVVIANPTAGGGRGARTIARIRQALARRGVTDIRVTGRVGDDAGFTRAALDEGADVIIALGGDGTWSHVAAAIAHARAPARLALLAAGTGNDFVKTLGLPASDVSATLDLIERGATRPVDLGRVGDRLFLNVAGFGFDAHVLRHMRRPRWVPASAMYAWVAARELRRFHGVCASVDDGPRERLLTLVVANGRRFGGVFSIAPSAAIDDGRLDLVRIRDANALVRARLLVSAIGGRHVRHRLTLSARAESFRVVFDEPPWFQADGELHQAPDRTVTLSVAPRALHLVAP